ncbi:DUF5131 family protein [Symbiobacterium thermophilum]|uniref:Phage Gp37/Gp68 family protein n=1 Tax=Symbiobacterium thermophilum TaxID=2734 RepID=A0A953LK25_SYMTR|nr:phage Gp37/Gp68 family protein [Symbiobacterium thermophilum]MBY6277849.1 phage Gp37/Gp68 family protein [Symbiobacterium thermophilum]
MADRTAIEWTDATWNPIRGCSRVSEGCRHCYAERQAARFAGKGQPYEGLVRSTDHGPRWTGQVRLVEKLLDAPLHWRRPRRIFVNSMSDLFHENVPDEWIDRIFAVMALTPWHTYQILTKRPERMYRYLTSRWTPAAQRLEVDGAPATAAYVRVFARMVEMYPHVPAHVLNRATDWLDEHYTDGAGFLRAWPLPNVWLGVSVENQAAADERIPFLLQTPAAVRWLSMEPLLGQVNLREIRYCALVNVVPGLTLECEVLIDALTGEWDDGEDTGREAAIDWVVVGGESGPGARPMHPDWVRSIRDQCQSAGVPFFFKQWGEYCYPSQMSSDTWQQVDMAINLGHHSDSPIRVGKRAAGALLDGREWREWPDERRELTC